MNTDDIVRIIAASGCLLLILGWVIVAIIRAIKAR